MIAVYTPEVVQTILDENPEIVDKWLTKLNKECVERRKQCEFENDTVACFNLSFFEEFEKHFKSWQDGGMVAIRLPGNRTINARKMPLFSVVTPNATVSGRARCEKCLAAFADIPQLEEQYKLILKPASGKARQYVIEARSDADKYYSRNPMWW